MDHFLISISVKCAIRGAGEPHVLSSSGFPSAFSSLSLGFPSVLAYVVCWPRCPIHVIILSLNEVHVCCRHSATWWARSLVVAHASDPRFAATARDVMYSHEPPAAILELSLATLPSNTSVTVAAREVDDIGLY